MTSPSGSEAKTTLVSFFGFFLYNGEDMGQRKAKLSKPTAQVQLADAEGGDVLGLTLVVIGAAIVNEPQLDDLVVAHCGQGGSVAVPGCTSNQIRVLIALLPLEWHELALSA
jgi:hypothetical protein